MLVHLFIHSDYSLLRSCITIPELVEAAAHSGSRHLALVDRQTMAGSVEFQRECRNYGIHPIFGLEIPVQIDPRQQVDLVLLAETDEGYRNLLRLASLEGPRSLTELQSVAGQIIALSGSTGRGWFTGTNRSEREVRQRWASAVELFGADHFFVQLEVDDEAKKERSQWLWDALQDRPVGFVGVQEGCLLRSSQQRALACMETMRTSEPIEFKPVRPLARPEVLEAAFARFPGAAVNTLSIAERCHADAVSKVARMPKPISDSNLWQAAERGLAERLGEIPVKYRERLEHEYAVISRMGFSEYFQIVADITSGARTLHIPIGPGRGSAAGSLMAYALGITAVDPIEHGLMFERFLNANRQTLPDIDLDFCSERRDEVVRWIMQRYGRSYTARIGTYATFGAKAALREAARVLAVDQALLQKCLRLLGPAKQTPDWAYLQQRVPAAAVLLETAQGLYGCRRTASIHAAGVVIADQPMEQYSSLRRHNDGTWITQMDMSSLEQLGLLKIDVLGLRTLTILQRAEKLVQEKYSAFRLQELDYGDDAVYHYLCSQQPLGIFQLESSLFQDVIQQLQPRNMNDLITVLAVGRPGPLQFVPALARRREGGESANPLHPFLSEVTASTYGLLLFQEQVMAAAHVVGGLTLAEADALRSAMSKKRPGQISEYREKFVTGAQAKGLSASNAGQLFDQMEQFAGYAFNKSHSAAYAHLSYQCAYLKYHYPAEFFAALLQSGENHSQAAILRDALHHNVQLLPIDLRYSKALAYPEGNGLRLGFANVSGISAQLGLRLQEWVTAEKPVSRQQWQNQTIVPPDALAKLVAVGALDSMGSREQLVRALRLPGDVSIANKPMAQKECLGVIVPDETLFGWVEHLRRFGRLFGQVVGGTLVANKRGGDGTTGTLLTASGVQPFFSPIFPSVVKEGELLACFGQQIGGRFRADWILPLSEWYVIMPASEKLSIAAAVIQKFPGNKPLLLALSGGVYQLADEHLWVDGSKPFREALRGEGISFTVLQSEDG